MKITTCLTTVLSSLLLLFVCAPANASDFLVKFTPRTSPSEIVDFLQREALSVLDYFKTSQIYHLSKDGTRPQDEILNELNADPTVLYAEPNYTIQANLTPNDPRFPDLWALHNTGQYQGTPGIDLGMEAVWQQMTAPSPVIVAVLDSGIDYTHEDLAANMWVNPGETPGNGIDDDGNGYVDDIHGYNFLAETGDPADDYFHGTHVAGTIGAVGNNGIGITGINWNVKLMALKFMGTDGNGEVADAIRGIDYAVKHGAKVINNSWDFTFPGLTSLPSNPSLEPVKSLRDAIVAADQAGVLFVTAAGNTGSSNDLTPHYPSSYSLGNILSVAAIDNKDTLPPFSNYGPTTVDLGAPGVMIESTFPSWKETPPYHFLSGTSTASPYVAGAAALLMSDHPYLTHRQVRDLILQGVDPVPDLTGKTVTGGRLDLAGSVLLTATSINHPPVANAGAPQSRLLGDTVLLQGTATDADGDTPLMFQWTLTSPANDQVSFEGPQASFVATLAGTYLATLIASDGTSLSVPSAVKIVVAAASPSQTPSDEGTQNGVAPSDQTQTPPTIIVTIEAEVEGSVDTMDPTQGGKVIVGKSIQLDGTGSRILSSEDEPLDYRWVLVEKPVGSECLIQDEDQSVASMVPDLDGRFTVQLEISAGKYSSRGELALMALSDSLPVTAGSTPPVVASGGCSLLKQN